MTVPLTLLGLLEREPSHGYDLKRDYDAWFGRGKPLPFGAEVKDPNGGNVGYVGQNGQAFVRLPDDNSVALTVDWDGGQCALDWQPANAKANAAGLSVVAGTCHVR